MPSQPPGKISRSLANLARRAGFLAGGRPGDGAAAAVARDYEADDTAPEEIHADAAHADVAEDNPTAALASNKLPGFVLQFAEKLEESDATEIEQVVEMAARFITHDLGQADFKRVQLIRLVRMATEDSIGRDAVLTTMMRLSENGVLSQGPNGRYQLSAS
jgi:hypothetical protein